MTRRMQGAVHSLLDRHFAGLNQQAVETLHACAASDDPDVHLLFNSEGGSVWPGQHARTMLESYPGKVSICNVGVAYSAAVSVFLAAEKRSCAPAATFAFHNLSRTYKNGISLNAKESTLIAAANEVDTSAMIEWVASRTVLDQTKIAELCASHYPVIKGAQWALDNVSSIRLIRSKSKAEGQCTSSDSLDMPRHRRYIIGDGAFTSS